MGKTGKMERAGSLFLAAAVAVMLGALSAFGQNPDPCSQSTQLSASGSGVRTWNGTVNATTVGGSGDDAYGVEAWTEAGGNATKLTWYGPSQGGGYAFKAEWTNSTDYLGRFGYFWGTNGKSWDNLGDLCVDYNYKRSANGTGGSYSYIGVYGWTNNGNKTEAEYYIVEDWFGSGQQAANNLGNNCTTHGNISVDGKTYQVVVCTRPAGSGCVTCGGQSFKQVFSIRQGMRNPEPPKCGTISISKHFKEWMKIPAAAAAIYTKTYESKFLVEAQGGTGSFDATYMKFSRTGACHGGVTVPAGSYTLTVGASPVAGGTVTRNPDSSYYSNNKSVNITAKPATGYQFDGWDGDASGTTNPLAVTMNKNKTIAAKFSRIPDATTNLVKNGNFTSTSDWTLNKWQNSAGTFAVSGGKANITGITLPSGEGAAAHSLQLVQNGIELTQGTKYRVSFDAVAAGAVRTIGLVIQMDIDPWTTYFSKDTIQLTLSTQEFMYEFEMTKPTDDNSRIAFNFGNATPNVTISNVKIGYVVGNGTGIAPARRPPTVAAAKPTLRAAAVSSGVKVSFKASEDGPATLRLYSLKGDVLSATNLQTVSGKSYTHTLNPGSKLPGGFYMVGLQRGSGGAVERVSVLVP